MVVGIEMFWGDILMREMKGDRMFKLEEKKGGRIMIMGWICIGCSGWF